MDLNVKTSNGKEFVVPIEQQNEMLVRKTIHRNDHPHPVVLITIIVIVIILIYIIYIIGVKKNITGDWYDGTATSLQHDVWTDIIYIDGYPVGNVSGNAVFIENIDPREPPFMGVLYKKKIYWSNGAIWTHVQYV
jgi:hypothetical protein